MPWLRHLFVLTHGDLLASVAPWDHYCYVAASLRSPVCLLVCMESLQVVSVLYCCGCQDNLEYKKMQMKLHFLIMGKAPFGIL